MKKYVVAWILTLALLFSVVGVASAITDGELDGDDHPHVVLLLMDIEGSAKYRCSATMLTPTVVLTAGHCTSNYPYLDSDGNYEGDYTGMRIFTESDVDAGLENGTNTYPTCDGGNCIEAFEWYAHPLYETDDPFYMHDVGIVILEEPYDPGVFGKLPEEADQFDNLPWPSGRRDKTWFTSVGYGRQAIFSDEEQWHLESVRVRMVANPFLLQLNVPGITGDYSLLLSNNHATGGTCFGDSGGPNFLGKEDDETNIVAGVTSFGMNQNCAGTGGVFRMDRKDVLDFVEPFLEE